jgi:hypothetical protein
MVEYELQRFPLSAVRGTQQQRNNVVKISCNCLCTQDLVGAGHILYIELFDPYLTP